MTVLMLWIVVLYLISCSDITSSQFQSHTSYSYPQHQEPFPFPGGGGGGGPGLGGPVPSYGPEPGLPPNFGTNPLEPGFNPDLDSLGPGLDGLPFPSDEGEIPYLSSANGGAVMPGRVGEGVATSRSGEAGSGFDTGRTGSKTNVDEDLDSSHTENTGPGDSDDDNNDTVSKEEAGFANLAEGNSNVEGLMNSTMAMAPEDDFNYVAMYVTVAIFITFIVTMVAIALIRGPQGPFKTKPRSDQDLEASGGMVAVIEDGRLRSVAQWERQPLKSNHDNNDEGDEEKVEFTKVMAENCAKGEQV